MNFAFVNPRLWLRNSLKAAPKIKQRWRDWLNAPSLDEIIQAQGCEIDQLKLEVISLKGQARNLHHALERQTLVTAPPSPASNPQ